MTQPAAVFDEERTHAEAEPTPHSSDIRYEHDVTSFDSVDLARSDEPRATLTATQAGEFDA